MPSLMLLPPAVSEELKQTESILWYRSISFISIVSKLNQFVHLNKSNIAGIPRMSSVTIFQSDHFVLSTNFLFKFNVSLPLVTGELLQNTVDVNNVTYKLYNIKLQRLPVLLNTKNYLSTGQAIT